MTSGYDWTGAVGDTWAAEWRRTDRSLADLSRHLNAAILAAAPGGAFRALDIGCGAGGTSLALAAVRPDATITGVDLSAGLVEVARDRASNPPVLPRRRKPSASSDDHDNPGLPPTQEHMGVRSNMTFHVGDVLETAQGLAPFDLLYSRHGVMFFDDPLAAFTALHAAATPDARLVFSCFADWADNAFATTLADATGSSPPTPRAPGPFAFADRDHVATILEAAGWRDAAPRHVPFTYRAGDGAGDAAIADALTFFQRIGPAAPALRAAPPGERAHLLDRVTAVIRDHHTGNAIDFPAAAWIWSATA